MRKFFHLVVILLCSPIYLLGYVYQVAEIWFAAGCDRKFFAHDRED